MTKKSLLFIHPFLPYPLTSGGHQALFNGIKAVKDDYDVTLAFMDENTPTMQKNIKEFHNIMPNVVLRPLLKDVEPIHIPSFKEKIYIKFRIVYHILLNFLKKIIGVREIEIVAPQVRDITSYWESTIVPRQKDWIEHIYKVSREKNYDLIQVEMPWMIKDVFALPDDVKKIHVHHELGFVRRELEIANSESTPYNESRKKYVDLNEVSQLNMYDAVVSLSPIDKKKMQKVGVNVPIHTSFAIVDTSRELSLPEKTEKRLTFIGPDAHNPNFVGIIWFLENCWKKLKAIDPEYTLDIIGKWKDSNINDINQKFQDVHFLGFVDDLYRVLKGSIMIVPITVGSGIRMKILEACSMGVPFVSTTVGAEGIPVEDGVHCYLTDDADIFINNILQLQNVNMQVDLVINAYQMVKENYSMKALRCNRLEIYKNV